MCIRIHLARIDGVILIEIKCCSANVLDEEGWA